MRTPQELIWAKIVYDECKGLKIELPKEYSSMTQDELENWYHEECGWGAKDEMRYGDEKTGLESKDWSRHYESHEVASRIGDQWIGWTCWTGGGKYGNPEEIDWIEGAYYLECEEKVETITNRYFNRLKGDK